MARRNRRATRAAPRAGPAPRQAERTAEHPAARREIARESARAGARRTARAAAPTRAGGAPTPVLERAATLERNFVTKDSRRLTVTVAVMLALLVASGFVVNSLFP